MADPSRRPGAPHGPHSILRVSNVGGREIRFHRDGSVVVWDGKLMHFRPIDDQDKSEVLAWLRDLRDSVEAINPPASNPSPTKEIDR